MKREEQLKQQQQINLICKTQYENKRLLYLLVIKVLYFDSKIM